MNDIILIGLSGSGKTTVGRTLAKKMGRPFLDTDEMVVRLCGRSVAEIFAADGEAAFRKAERQALVQALSGHGAVIATGGGIVLDAANRRAMKQNGTVFFLDRDVETILRTVDLSDRPLLCGDRERLREQAKTRSGLYRAAADFTLAGGSVRELTELIETMYEMTAEEP